MKHGLSVPLAFAFGIVTAAGFATVATADSSESAEAALARGNAALKAGRVTEACAAFDASMKLDPAIETRLRLAKCFEQEGKLVSAARLYRDAADDDANAPRRQTSIAKAAKLEARAARLRLTLTLEPANVVVKVDGIEVPADDDVLVDLGPHEIIATAPGYLGRTSVAIDREKQILDVIVRVEPVAKPAAEPMPARPPSPAAAPADDSDAEAAAAEGQATTSTTMRPIARSKSTGHRMRNGIVLGAAGVGLLVGAGVLFKLSSDKFDQEQALCPQSACRSEADLARARELISESRTRRGLSIGLGIGGALALAAGTYLLMSPAKEEAPRLSLEVDARGTSVAYTVGF